MASHQQIKQERWSLPRVIRLVLLGLVTFITGTALLVATLYNKDADITARAPTTIDQPRSWRGKGTFPGSGDHAYHSPDATADECSSKIHIPKARYPGRFYDTLFIKSAPALLSSGKLSSACVDENHARS